MNSVYVKFYIKKLFAVIFISLLIVLAGCNAKNQTADKPTKVITDMGGRQVTVPQVMQKVFCSNPIGTVDVYTLAPDKLAGWNFAPSGDSVKYIDSTYMSLPSLGVWMGAGATPNQEEIAKVNPDVIFCFWTCDKTGVEMADTIQAQTGIPVILMDYNITAAPKVYRLLGEYLGVQDRAEQLAQYCDQILDALNKDVSAIPEKDRKTVFISEGSNGLQTDPVGSIHVQDALDLLKLKNVADLPGTNGQGMGMPTVSPEQLLIWQPDAILVSEYSMGNNSMSDIYGTILTGSNWSSLSAVKNHAVYRIPQVPFSWFGKPPSAARLLGCLWLMDTLYPDSVKIDIRQETRDFYSLFYRIELTDDQLNSILPDSGINGGTK